MKHYLSTMLLVGVISATCIVAAQYTADATSTTGATLSPTGANMTNNINPNTLTSAQIMQIQQTLKNDGVSINIDGVWSPAMTAALTQYQTAHGLTASGTLTAQTVDNLGVNLSTNTATGSSSLNTTGSANFGSTANSNLNNTTGENQIQGSAAAGLNTTVSPAAGSSATGTGASSSISPVTSPTGPGNTIVGGVGGATGSAAVGGVGAGGSTGGVGGATGSAGTGGAAGR